MSARQHNPAKRKADHDSRKIKQPGIICKIVHNDIKRKIENGNKGGSNFVLFDPIEKALLWFLVGFMAAWVLILHFLTNSNTK